MNKRIDETLLVKLNNIKLTRCEGIKIGEVYYHYATDRVSIKGGIFRLIQIIKRDVCANYHYEIIGSPQILMLFSNSYIERQDHLIAFKKVCHTCRDYVSAIAGKFYKAKSLHTLSLVILWYRQLRLLDIGMLQRWYIVNVMHMGYCDYQRLIDFLQERNIKIKYVVSVCDVMPVDSFIIQKFNSIGMKTITLQHGTFNRGSHAYTGSLSTLFLAHSIWAKENGIESGLDADKIIVVGAPQNIRVTRQIARKHTGVIGVILGGRGREKYDDELISMVRKYANKYNYKVFAKLHPGSDIKFYPKEFQNEIDRIYKTEISVSQFTDLVDFTVDNGSTAFIENLARNRITFTYICPNNAYGDNVKIKLAFRNYSEMMELFYMYENNMDALEKMLESDRGYLATDKDPYYLYSDFWKEL